MRKLIYLFLSIFLVFSSVTSSYAASSWSIRNAISKGASTVIVAGKSGYTSAVSVAPKVASVSAKLLRGANTVAVGYALFQLLNKSVDHVMDPANNRVIYTPVRDASNTQYMYAGEGYYFDTPLEACKQHFVRMGRPNNFRSLDGMTCKGLTQYNYPSEQEIVLKALQSQYIPIDTVSNAVIANANNGHAPSQAVTKATAIEMVIGGTYDAQLQSGAVPTSISDDDAVISPSTPITGGDAEGGLSGAAPGSQTDTKAAADAAAKAAAAAQAAADAAKDAAANAAADAQDLVNSAIDQAVKDAVAEAAKDAAAAADAAAVKAAEAAKTAAEKAAADARAAANALADANARAEAAAKAAADAAADASKSEAEKAAAQAAADAAKAEAAAAKARAEAAEAAAAKAKENIKPFELPAFCTWASIVCETAEWLKKDPVIDESSGDIEVQKTDETMHVGILERLYIDMPAQCPADPLLEFMGAKIPFPMSVFCQFASMMKPLILLFAYIKGLSIIGNGLT